LKIETSGGLGQGWRTPNNWGKSKEENEVENIIDTKTN
jgi:hypothetical protein